MVKPFTIFTMFCLSAVLSSASEAHGKQQDTFTFREPIHLDEVVVRASKSGFDINAFVEIIRKDTTFYKAFKDLRMVTFNAENDIRVYDNKRGGVKASLKSETKQVFRDGCRVMHVLEEKTTGDFYKRNGDYNYFTATLFASVFFTKGKVCGEDNIVAGSLEREGRGKGRIEKSKIQLKQLIFNPGTAIPGVPFIGNKVAIFDPKIAKMYEFTLSADRKNGVACYLFEAKPKQQHRTELVINEFKTWFNQNDYTMVARTYSLSYKAGIYDFDVKMQVDLKKIGNKLLPAHINYDGEWFVLSKGREKAKFTVQFDY